MKVKFSAVILLLHFGLLQASHSKIVVIPVQDEEAAIADYLKPLEAERESRSKEAIRLKEEQQKIKEKEAKFKAIRTLIDHRAILFKSAQVLSHSNITKNKLVKIGDSLCRDVNRKKCNSLYKAGLYDKEKASHTHERIITAEDDSYIYKIENIREDLVFAKKQYNDRMNAHQDIVVICAMTCCCCGLCIIPVLLDYISFYKRPSQDDVNAKVVQIKDAVDIMLESTQEEVKRLNKDFPDLMQEYSSNASKSTNSRATRVEVEIPLVPFAVVTALEIDRR